MLDAQMPDDVNSRDFLLIDFPKYLDMDIHAMANFSLDLFFLDSRGFFCVRCVIPDL